MVFQVLFEELYILNLAIAKGLQRKGLGSLLLKCLFDFSRLKGVERVVLDVHRKNQIAQRFYKKHGFSFAKDCQRSRGKLLVMVRELD